MKKLLFTGAVLLLDACQSVEPNVKIEDRLRPPYNYALMQKIDDTTFGYNWSYYNDGYYRTGEKFYSAYLDVMKSTNDMSNDNAYKIYSKQKSAIAKKYKTQGDKVQATKGVAINEFSPSNVSETEEIVVTKENEFAVTEDIVVKVEDVKE